MQGSNQHLIAREGWPVLTALLLLLVLAKIYIGVVAALFCFALIALCTFVFRNPAYAVPPVPLAVVSPVCGRLSAIKTLEDQCLSREAVRFRLQMSLWDVHAVRSPIEGKVIKEWSAKINGSSYQRRYSYWIQTDEGDDVILSLAMGKWAPIVKTKLHTGERIGQGQLCGYFYFAGVIDVWVPRSSKLEAKIDDQLTAGSAILGCFVHEPGAAVTGKQAAIGHFSRH